MPEDMIGAIKIKDGLFIGDEFSAQVKKNTYFTLYVTECVGSRVCGCEQSDTHSELCR